MENKKVTKEELENDWFENLLVKLREDRIRFPEKFKSTPNEEEQDNIWFNNLLERLRELNYKKR